MTGMTRLKIFNICMSAVLIAAFTLVSDSLAQYDSRFTSTHFSGSGNCRRCHNGLTDHIGTDVSIERSWNSTVMANASKDPMWKAKVRSEINRNPHLESLINDKCTKCHAPMANVEAHDLGDPVEVFGTGFLNPANAHFDQAMESISCTLCHQIMDSPDLGTLSGFSGHYEIETFPNAVDRKLYGPYDNIVVQPMRNNVSYTITHSPHIQASKVCAACHNLKTPYVDEHGNVLSTTPESEFPEQMPYSEWEHSDYAVLKSCQDCHMTRTDGVVMASRPPWVDTLRNGFAVHHFAGANKLMNDILNTNRLDLDVMGDQFTYNMNQIGQMTAAAAGLTITQSAWNPGVLDFTVHIESLTGHKLPSAFPSRRVIVHTRVRNSSGQTVFESGKINPDGTVDGVDSDADILTVEPHYDLIENSGQVQVYEAIMENNLGEVTYTLLRGMNYVKDNRLLPAGFDKFTAPDDVRVAGAALGDVDFTGGGDELTYRISGLSDGSPFTVSVELVYQTVSGGFAQDLFTETDPEIVEFRDMFNASTYKSVVIDSLEFTVP